MPENGHGLRIALVGLGFGAEFAAIYRDRPDVDWVALCDPNPEKLAAACERFGVTRRFASLNGVLASSEIDAVHLVTPIPLHSAQSVAVLNSGKLSPSQFARLTKMNRANTSSCPPPAPSSFTGEYGPWECAHRRRETRR